MYKLICFLAILGSTLAQTRLQWSLCGPSVLQVSEFDLGTMPITHPGPMPFILAGKSIREIRGAVKSTVTIKRTVSGITLPITCYLVDGNYVGSCTYPDLCLLLKSVLGYDANSCPQNLIDNNIDCTCPFKLPARELNVDVVADLPDATTSSITWIASGSFDVKVEASDSVGQPSKRILFI
ncbi:ganglioside GM2 [Brachionus plicatilis]|uniref:Ganglioside GM2 n=1 Tax=Brachionus plicatilis TaxID=10195 RepID=A0A3M7RYP3_BRAPC|nr:ganglioside GM2 [Brachionus plicatilis]